jgi:Anti-sigma-28 factor, FlgM
MQQQELKSLVESGHYKPDPSRVAAAMLERRGVRELLIGGNRTLSRAGRTPSGPQSPRRAA